MANITVELPDGRIVDTGTDNAELAQSRIEEALRAERPLPGFFQSAVQGARGTFGSAVTGAGTIAGAVGLPGEQTLRGIGEAISGEEPQDTRNPELADFLSQPFATARALTGQGLGSVAAFLATGAGAGLLARTVFGLGARATAGAAGAQRAGTVAGTVGAGALASTGELEEGLLAEGVNPERARMLAASLGPLIGVAETANLAGLARRVLGREMTEETARQIAQRGMLSAMARTGGREAFLEALTEGGAETARQGVIAAETGNLNPEERFAAIALGTIAGGLTGGTIGAPGGLLERGAARRQIESLDASREPPPPGPETEPSPAPDLGAPTPFTNEATAREYLFGASNDPETLRERMRVNPALAELEGQALINEANRIQTEDNLRAQRRIAQSIVDDLLLPQTTDPTTGERNVPPPDEYAREIVRSISAYNNNLTEDQQPISLTGGFRADDIVRAAFARAEQPVTEGPLFNAAAGRANQLLKQLADIGILQPRKQGNKTFYTLAEPNAEERAARTERGQTFAQAPQPAPLTAEQSAATELLQILTRSPEPKAFEAEATRLERSLTERGASPATVQLGRALYTNMRERTKESTDNLLEVLNRRIPPEEHFYVNYDAIEAINAPDGREDVTTLLRQEALTRAQNRLHTQVIGRLEALAGQQPATAITSTIPSQADIGTLGQTLLNSWNAPTVESAQALANALNVTLPTDQQIAFDPAGNLDEQLQTLRPRALNQLRTLSRSKYVGPEMADSSRPDAAAIMAQESADTVEFFRQRAQEIGLEAAVNDPETAATLFSGVVGGNPNITNWSFKKVQNALRDDFGINVTPEQAGKIIRAGRDAGIVDNTFKVRAPKVSPEMRAAIERALLRQNASPLPPAQETTQERGPSAAFTETNNEPNFTRREPVSDVKTPQQIFADDLFFVYSNLAKQKDSNWTPNSEAGPNILLKDIYKFLKNYTPQQFANALVQLDYTPNTKTSGGQSIYFGGSTGAKNAKNRIEVTYPDGRKGFYVGIAFRKTPDQPNFARREPEYALSDEYTEAEIQAAEQIFRQAVGPSARLQWAQNLRIENLRGTVRAFLERENADLPINQRITEISGYALGDLVVLSMARDNNWSITETAIHEGQHVAENIGLFSRQDRELLNANSQAILAGIKDRVGQFEFGVASADPREMRAYGLNAYLRGARFNPVVNGIFGRIQRFMQRLANYLRGRGYQTVDDVYSRFLSGRMAAPAPQTAAQLEAAFGRKAIPVNTQAFRNWFGNSVVRNPDGSPKVVYHVARMPKSRVDAGAPFVEFKTSGTTQQAGAHFGANVDQANQIAEEIVSVRDRRGFKSFNTSPVMYPVYLSLKNPIRLSDRGEWSFETIVNQLKSRTAEYWQQEIDNEQRLVDAINADLTAEIISENSPAITVRDGTVERIAELKTIKAQWSTISRQRLNDLVGAANNKINQGIDPDRATQWLLRQLGFDSIEYVNAFEGAGDLAYIVFEPTQIKSAISNTGAYSPTDPRINFAAKPPPPPATRTSLSPGFSTTPLSLLRSTRSLPSAPQTAAQLEAAFGRKAIPTNTQAFRNWFGNSVVTNPDGSPLVLYRGLPDTAEQPPASLMPVKGRAAYFSTNPVVADSYAADIKTSFLPRSGAIFPVYIKANKLIEFPVRIDAYGYPSFDMFEFDRKAKLLKPGEILVARGVSDGGPRGSFGNNRPSTRGDTYAIGAGTEVRSAVNPTINFMGKPPPGARSATSGPILTPKETQNLGWWAQNFGSPTQAGKFNARYNPVSQVQQETVSAVNQVQMPAEKAIAPLYDLAPVDLAAATRAWSQANRAGQPVNTAGLSPKAADAVKQASDALQKIFDAAIEAYVQPFFNPANAKTPAEKAALDAMWAKHSGKTLLAIPDADLRAASPKGFKELSEFRGKRRPGYLPMMMSGSHYMAVYSKGPGGKRNLEKIVFFDPSTFVQRRFGQNEEAYFRQQLEKRYPDRTKFEITKAAPARTTDRRPEIQAILESRNAVNDFIQTFMDPSMNAATKQKIAESMKFLDKQQMGRLFRPFDDKLLALHDRNESTYLLDALPQYIMGISKIIGYRQTDDAFRDSIANLSAQDQQHFKTLRTYGSMPTEAFGTLRSFQFFWLLGGAVDTAIINMLQPIQLTTPLLLRDGANIANVGSAYKDVSMGFDFFSSMKDAFTGKQTDLLARLKSRLRSADEVAAIEAADKAGVFTPLFTNESRGQFTVEAMRRMGAADPRKSAAKANRITGAMGSLMQTVEQYNRAVTFVAAYRAAKENPAIIQRANQLDNTNYQTAADYARGTVVSSQFLITKEDRALIQRAHPVMEVATQFMSYPIKAIEQMVLAANQSLRGMKDGDSVLVKAGAFSLLAQVVPLVMLAGVWALPLAEPLRELIELAWGNGLNLDQELRRFVGPDAAPFASRGVPHALGVANLSGRLALSPVDFNQLTEPTLLNLLGPTGSFIENVNLLDDNSPIRRYWENGDWVGLSTVFTPRFVSNIIRGSSLAAGYDQFTRQGNALVQAEEVRTGEALMVATGFPPPRFTNMRDMVNAVEEQNRQITQRSQRDNMRAAGYYTQILEANRDNNPQALARAQENLRAMMQEIAEHNARIYDLALVNEEEFRRQLPRLRQWNPNAIARRAIANYYGISDEIPLTRMANQRVRPQMEDLRRLYNLQ